MNLNEIQADQQIHPSKSGRTTKVVKHWRNTFIAAAIVLIDVLLYPWFSAQSFVARGIATPGIPKSISGQIVYILHMPGGFFYLILVAAFFALNIAAIIAGFYLVFTRYWITAILLIVYALITSRGATSLPPVPADIGLGMVLVGLWYKFNKRFIIIPADI